MGGTSSLGPGAARRPGSPAALTPCTHTPRGSCSPARPRAAPPLLQLPLVRVHKASSVGKGPVVGGPSSQPPPRCPPTGSPPTPNPAAGAWHPCQAQATFITCCPPPQQLYHCGRRLERTGITGSGLAGWQVGRARHPPLATARRRRRSWPHPKHLHACAAHHLPIFYGPPPTTSTESVLGRPTELGARRRRLHRSRHLGSCNLPGAGQAAVPPGPTATFPALV